MSTLDRGLALQRDGSLGAAARKANDATWRRAVQDGDTGTIRIICECEDPECTRTITATVNDYLRLRTSPLIRSHYR
jgi:hypothetical protein